MRSDRIVQSIISRIFGDILYGETVLRKSKPYTKFKRKRVYPAGFFGILQKKSDTVLFNCFRLKIRKFCKSVFRHEIFISVINEFVVTQSAANGK